eukprot:TRINITY_DN21935_c0_g2_i1.p1 TRINITY_DN21935_c0_g2~~TRINITY_DN21935_c0_g2_i1.p1  ORF type:complete len:452 (-),score=81.38 TRINITY_DN21935_c0_g2_i1:130-1353(-)
MPSDQDWATLCSAIRQNTKLEQLTLIDLSTERSLDLVDAVAENSSLWQLRLGVVIPAEFMSRITKLLRANRLNFIQLYLTSNVDQMVEHFHAIQHSCLTNLYLEYASSSPEEEASIFSLFLPSIPRTAKVINISEAQLSCKLMEELVNSLSNLPSLEMLNIIAEVPQDLGYLAMIIRRFPSLRKIKYGSLQGEFDAEKLPDLLNALRENQGKLESLSFGLCEMESDDNDSLAAFLHGVLTDPNISLTRFELLHPLYSTDAVEKAFTTGFASNKTLISFTAKIIPIFQMPIGLEECVLEAINRSMLCSADISGVVETSQIRHILKRNRLEMGKLIKITLCRFILAQVNTSPSAPWIADRFNVARMTWKYAESWLRFVDLDDDMEGFDNGYDLLGDALLWIKRRNYGYY